MALRARLGLLLVLALLAAACSGAAADPKEQLTGALRAMSQDPGMSLTLSLDSDEASLRALAEGEQQEIPPAVVTALLRMKLRISGTVSDDPAKAPAELALLDGDEAVAELRFVDDTLFVRADVPALMRAFGQDPATADGLRQMIGQSGVVPPGAFEGEWIGISGIGQALAEMSGGQDPTEQAVEQAKRVRDALARILADVPQVTSVGSDAAGDHLRVDVPLRELYDAVLTEAPQMGLPADLPPRDEVPDETVTVDLWVRDGRISQVSFDLRQLAKLDAEAALPAEVERLALRLGLEPFDGVVEAPEGAAELDAGQLMGAMFMGLGAMMGGGSMPGMPPVGMPGPNEAEPAALQEPGGPNPVLVAFWSRPGYEAARAFYCRQIADLPLEMRRRHYGDICPALAA